MLSLKMICCSDKFTCYIFAVNCKTRDTQDYINNILFRMLNFQQNPYKSLITFANSDDGDDALFFFFTPRLAGVKDKAN